MDPQATGEQEAVAILARLTEGGVGKEPLLEVVDEVGVSVAAQRRRVTESQRLVRRAAPLVLR